MFKRHLLKTVSYRVIGTVTTVSTIYFLGGDIELASLIGIGELLVKPVIYLIHERVWYKWIKIGRNK
jgi:uncharacterized membrane protein